MLRFISTFPREGTPKAWVISFTSRIHTAWNPQGKAPELGRQQSILPNSLYPPPEFYYGSYSFFKTQDCGITRKACVFSNSHLLGSSHMHIFNTRKVDRIVPVEAKSWTNHATAAKNSVCWQNEWTVSTYSVSVLVSVADPVLYILTQDRK